MSGMSKPVVDYCNAQVPENQQALNEAFAVAMRTMNEAGKRYLEELGPDAEEPLDQGARALIAQSTRASLETAKKYDPEKYCRWLEKRFLTITPEAALQQMRDGYRDAKLKSGGTAGGR
jgi:hypothetical protein